MAGCAHLVPVICMYVSCVNVIALDVICCITGQTTDLCYGWGSRQVFDYKDSVCLFFSHLWYKFKR